MSRRKAEMVLELIDRATRPGQRIMAMTKRLAKTNQLANRVSARTSKLAARATDKFRSATKSLAAAQEGLQAKIKRSNQLIDKHRAKLRSSASLIGSGAKGVGKALVLAGGMYTAYSGSMAAAATALIGPAAQFERYSVQLKSLEGSAEKGRAAMEWIEGFATRTPLELNQVVEAYQQMKTFGLDPTNGSLMALVDTMAAGGKGAEHLSGLTLALGKSWTKSKLQGEEIMMLMERGVPVYDILSAKLGKTAEQIQKMGTAGKLGRNEIQILIDEMGRMNSGASEDMSRTWDGIISNILDSWTRFRRMIADSGVFDFMKARLRGFLSYINELDEAGKLQEYADAIAKNILTGLEAMWNFGKAAVTTWQAVYPWIEYSAVALGGWRNLAMLILAIPMRAVLFEAAGGFFQIGRGALGASRAMAGIGWGQMRKGALKGAGAVLSMLNPLNLVRGALIALRVAFIATGIGALVAGLAMAGVWIYNNWSGLKSFFQGFGQGFMNALGPAAPLAEGVVSAVKKVWEWISKLLGPLDATEAQWAQWGTSVGQSVAGVVNFIADLPSRVWDALKGGWNGVSGWIAVMWSGLQWAASTAWDGLKYLLLNYTPHGLIYQNWDGITVWAATLWDGLLSAASTAWDGLKILLLNYTPHGLIYQNWDGITDYFSGLWDGVTSIFFSAWSFIYENVIVPMQNAVSFMTDNALTRGLSAAGTAVGDFFSGDDEPQKRAKGGSYAPGWLLTGEQGPEMRYETKGGYIAHNRALQRMVAMSRRINRNLAGSVPATARKFASAAAVTAGLSAPAAVSGEQYLTAKSLGESSTSASLSITINGNVDAQVMPDLKAEIEAAENRLLKKLAAHTRTKKRREHS